MFFLELGKFCFKFKNNRLPESFNNFFIQIASIHSYNTRNFQNRLYLKKQIRQTGLTTLSHMGAKFWNEIPNEIKDKTSMHTFIKSLKQFLINSK